MCHAVHNKYTIDVHCRKIYNLFVRALETGISKSPKQLPNCLQIDDTSVGLIVFIGVICDVSAYTCYRFFLLLYMNQVPEMFY
jgi:hypothetical protein